MANKRKVEKRFNHVLVNMVKDFKDSYHRYKYTGVADYFELAWTWNDDENLMPCTPSNAAIRAWFAQNFNQKRRRMALKAMNTSKTALRHYPIKNWDF